MVCFNLDIVGKRQNSAFECRVNSDARLVNLSQFEPLLRLCLARFNSEEGWVLVEDLFPELVEPSSGRKYIERIRLELDFREIVQAKRPRKYRLTVSRTQIHIDEQVWKLTEVDPLLLERLRHVYQKFLE